MSTLSDGAMREYLSRSIASLNKNKLNGLLAEIEFRDYLRQQGFASRVSRGGWIARRIGAGEFAHQTAVFFPETLLPGISYSTSRPMPQADVGLHTICATFHQTGISAFFCAATIQDSGGGEAVSWRSIRLGVPSAQEYEAFPASVSTVFTPRLRRYNFLRYHTDTAMIPSSAIAEEFSKENLRVVFQSQFRAEVSDVDGIFWGQRHTYPLEIKEKTAGVDRRMGEYFGLDVGPFVKLAYYSARRGNLHSLFVVREIDNVENRNLVQWWYITFEELAQYASWVSQAGGPGMGGGASSVVCIPKAQFKPLNRENIDLL